MDVSPKTSETRTPTLRGVAPPSNPPSKKPTPGRYTLIPSEPLEDRVDEPVPPKRPRKKSQVQA